MQRQNMRDRQGSLILPRDVARSAAKQLKPQTLAALAADAIASRAAGGEPCDALKLFATDLAATAGIDAFGALEASRAAVVHEAALRFVALVTGDRPE